MARFIFDLTDEDRDALEILRKQRRLRSHAEVVRALIREAVGSGLPSPEQQAAIKSAATARQAAYDKAVTAWSAREGPIMQADFDARVIAAYANIGPVRAKPGSRLKKR